MKGKYSKKELIYWKERYNSEEDKYNTGLENELRKKFNENEYITKEDLLKIAEWKFQKDKRRYIVAQKNMKNVPDEEIRNVSRLAFKEKNDILRVGLLTTIKGVGNSLCSVILTFYDPQNYGVLDFHDWKELFGDKPKDLYSNHNKLIDFFNAIREIASENRLKCRDVEKALFKKNLEQL